VERRWSAGWVALSVALAITLYLCWRMVQPFATILLWAAVLAVVFRPVHRAIESRVRRPSLSSAISTLLVVVTIVAPVSFITVAVVRELRAVATAIGTHEGPWIDPASPIGSRLYTWLGPYVDLQEIQSPAFLRENLEAWSGVLATGTLGFVGGVAAALVSMLLVVFTLYYLFRDGEALREALEDIVPIGESQAADIALRTREVIEASVFGVIVIAGIQGALGFFIFWVLGLPSPLLWGVVMFFLSMIPMAGAFLVWAPAAIYLALSGEFLNAAILIAWGVLVVGTIDNVLSPRLVGRRARMHELLIFFGVLGGIEVFGVLGVVLGPVVVAVMLALVEMVRQASRPSAAPAPPPGQTVLERQDQIRQAS
jgi:predicted PurR-regulated permease PerM